MQLQQEQQTPTKSMASFRISVRLEVVRVVRAVPAVIRIVGQDRGGVGHSAACEGILQHRHSGRACAAAVITQAQARALAQSAPASAAPSSAAAGTVETVLTYVTAVPPPHAPAASRSAASRRLPCPPYARHAAAVESLLDSTRCVSQWPTASSPGHTSNSSRRSSCESCTRQPHARTRYTGHPSHRAHSRLGVRVS